MIKEEDSSESDHEEEKSNKIDLSSYLETENFTEDAFEPKMSKDISDISKSIMQNFDIVDESGMDKSKRNFQEGAAEITDKLNIIQDYVDNAGAGKYFT